MKPFNCLIVDDEPNACDIIVHYCSHLPFLQVVAVCGDAFEAKSVLANNQIDIIFLDIRMPVLDGLSFLKTLKHPAQIIFTTAYNEYAIQAIRFSAFDYLLKPVDMEELQGSVRRFLESNEDYKQQYDLLKNILHNIQAPSAEEFRLALPTKEGVHFLQPANIIRCESLGNYTKFFMENGRTYLISKTLGEYDTLLSPHSFIRTHKSHLINKKFITFIDHDGFAVLKDGAKVEVSRRRKEEVMQALK